MNITLNTSGIWIACFSILYVLLTLHVVRMRWVTKTGLGVGEDRRMLKAVRVHGNFAEYIPLLLFIVTLLELRGTSANLLHGLYAVALLGRLLIIYGITKTSTFSPGRFLGNLLTYAVLLTASVLHLQLSF